MLENLNILKQKWQFHVAKQHRQGVHLFSKCILVYPKHNLSFDWFHEFTHTHTKSSLLSFSSRACVYVLSMSIISFFSVKKQT